MPSDLPTVSVLICAYNYEQYVGRAIESALAQDYPVELLEIIVVDDGSTDSTAEVVERLMRRHPGRIRLVQQENAGYIGATNRALAEARGELLALLDADDVWLEHKTRHQVARMQADPALGLVFGDMVVIDGDDAVIRRSHLEGLNPVRERCLPALLFSNFVTTSSIMVRASLRERFHPIPATIPYADWWLAVRAAEVSEIDFVAEPVARYRQHGANMTNGAQGEVAVRNSLMALAFQMHAFRHLTLDTLTPDELMYVWSGAERRAQEAVLLNRSFFIDLSPAVAPDCAEADRAQAEADRAALVQDWRLEARLVLQALGWDPYRGRLRRRLQESVARANANPFPLTARHMVHRCRLIVDARELLAADDLILAYAEAAQDADAISLIIDATELSPPEAEAGLQALLRRCELEDRDELDLIAIVGPQTPEDWQQLLSSLSGRFTRHPGGDGGLPVVTPETIGDLASTLGGSRELSPAL